MPFLIAGCARALLTTCPHLDYARPDATGQ